MKRVSADYSSREMFFSHPSFRNIPEKAMLHEGRERAMTIGENYVYRDHNTNRKDHKVPEEDSISNHT